MEKPASWLQKKTSLKKTLAHSQGPIKKIDQGNLLTGIDKKTVRREGISICLLMFSSH